MTSNAFDLARSAMASIELYRNFYSSSPPFQAHFQDVLTLIRKTAENAYSKAESYAEKKFLLAFADALEIANRSGEYVPLGKH